VTRRRLALIAGLYCAILLALVPVKPLWLDEIIELHVTSVDSLQKIAETPGGAPLGYAGQFALRPFRGANPIWESRLPSVAAGVACLVAFVLLCRRLLKSREAIAVAGALWCVCPLALRYSLEGRPYMQGMLFAILAVLAQLRLCEKASPLRFMALALSLAAAIWSQPFALFAPLVFSAWQVARRWDMKLASLTAGAYAVAALSFVPWYLHVQHYWSGSVLPNQGEFHLNAYLFATLLRECVGDGYPAAIAAVLAAAYGAIRTRSSLAWVVLGTVALALAADARFHYFFATRQIIYMLPFLLILMAQGLVLLWKRYALIAVALGVVFAVASLMKDYRHLADHTEDWVRLTAVVKNAIDGACLLTPSDHEAPLYSLMDPQMRRYTCGPSLANRVVVPITTYSGRTLGVNGFREVSSTQAGFATVKVFARGIY
jgi:hypothetical protein